MAIDHYSTATAMVAALRRREMSATELVEMHIARIAAHDGKLNAIPVRTFERARQAAQRADERLAAGDTAPLLGLPMTLKESTLTAGLPQSAGMLHFKDYRPALDGPIAAPRRAFSFHKLFHEVVHCPMFDFPPCILCPGFLDALRKQVPSALYVSAPNNINQVFLLVFRQ